MKDKKQKRPLALILEDIKVTIKRIEKCLESMGL